MHVINGGALIGSGSFFITALKYIGAASSSLSRLVAALCRHLAQLAKYYIDSNRFCASSREQNRKEKNWNRDFYLGVLDFASVLHVEATHFGEVARVGAVTGYELRHHCHRPRNVHLF